MVKPFARSSGMDILKYSRLPRATPSRWARRGPIRRILFNYLNRLRKKLISALIYFISFFSLLPTRSPRNRASAAAPPPSCRQRRAVTLPPPLQHSRCCNRATTVTLFTAATLRAAATAADAAAVLPPSFRRRRAVRLPPPPTLRCRHRRSICAAATTLLLDPQVIRRCVRVRIYLLSGRIPAKATKHLKSHLVTRYLIRNKKQETRRSK